MDATSPRFLCVTLLAAIAAVAALGACRRGSPRLGEEGRAAPAAAWLAAEPAAEARVLKLADRCNLLATVLTYRAPMGSETRGAQGVFVENEAVRAAITSQGVPVAGATVRHRDSQERSLFSVGESCGERLALLSPELIQATEAPRAFAYVELTPVSPDSFHFELQVAPIQGGAPQPFSPVAGRVDRRQDGEWVPSPEGRAPARPARPLDAAPHQTKLPTPLPPGRAEATFEIDTGGDMMGAPPKQAGLAAVVREGATERRQTIASCEEASRGSALGGGDNVLDVAICGDMFRLVARPGLVVVERAPENGQPVIVARFPLASSDSRASRPSPLER
jgi:hypothetical protein